MNVKRPTNTHAEPIKAPPAAVAASWGELLSGRNLLPAIALTGGVALHAINVHIVTTILPSVVRDIGGLEYYAWNITLFVVASILGATLTNKLLDVMGPRRTYLLALAVFVLGSILCATATGMFWLLCGRSVQGIGGGLLAALSYALIRIVFVERLWSRVVALVSGMWGLATLLGPAVGGLFAASGEWRLAFWSLLPVALVQALIVSMQLTGKSPVPDKASLEPVRIPFLKISLLMTSVLLVALAGQVKDDAGKVLCITVGVSVGLLLAWLDRRPGVALLPSGAYTLRSPMGKIFACIGLLMIASMSEIFIPYFLQLLHGYSPLQAGYMTAVMAGGWSMASLVSSGRSSRSTARLIFAGPVLMTLALLALLVLLPGDIVPAYQGAWLCIALAGVGLGIGLGWPHLLTGIFKAALPGEENIASAGITTVQLYAMAIGAALAGLTVNAAGLSDPGGEEGARTAAYSLFGFFALAPAAAMVLSYRLSHCTDRSGLGDPDQNDPDS
ncbi:MFS transporter [Methylobacter sp. S3L5C]|uniref:MFS transporter n=1 Tax=Methylobacter sp. S3L5C TaxID=2839024 RepID=UPI001FAD0ECD|nr:MFS transporter [Methylobacter sp. S3L5C]UOA07132.1 MFS transporter [Methylobacter sp. S3L5C]